MGSVNPTENSSMRRSSTTWMRLSGSFLCQVYYKQSGDVLLEKSKYLVDVGNIDGTTLPKRIVPKEVTLDQLRYFRFELSINGEYFLTQSDDQLLYKIYYKTDLQERKHIEFLAINEKHQYDSESFFMKNMCISKLNQYGARIILNGRKLKISHGRKKEITLLNEDDFVAKLEELFGITQNDLIH